MKWADTTAIIAIASSANILVAGGEVSTAYLGALIGTMRIHGYTILAHTPGKLTKLAQGVSAKSIILICPAPNKV